VRPLPGRLVLLGHPVSHSLSPAFQNAALRRAALPLRYEALDVPPESLDATLDLLVGEGTWGNVTIPHKERVARRCTRVTEIANRVGAVNTFWVEDGALVGDNTDVGGFLELMASTSPDLDRAKPVAVLGAGGAAAATIAALEQAGFGDIRIHGRTSARAAALCARFTAARAVNDLAAVVRGATLVVNATPAGLDGVSMPIAVGEIDDTATVLDLVVGPNETPFVRAARARGHRAADGLAMLLGQGALAFERWFGFPPDREVMRAAIEPQPNRSPRSPR
jgi:shikimate dehydrogenase